MKETCEGCCHCVEFDVSHTPTPSKLLACKLHLLSWSESGATWAAAPSVSNNYYVYSEKVSEVDLRLFVAQSRCPEYKSRIEFCDTPTHKFFMEEK